VSHIINFAGNSAVKLRLYGSLIVLVGKQIGVLARKTRRFEQVPVDSDVEELRFCALVWFADCNLFCGDSAADLASGVVEIPGKDRLCRANDHASRLQLGFHTMRAEVTFGCCIVVGVDVQGVIRTGLHAALAADTSLIVKIDDSVGALVEGFGGANGNAGG